MSTELEAASDVIEYPANEPMPLDLFSVKGRHARRIRPLGDGSMVVELMGTPEGEEREITVKSGADEELKVKRVTATDVAFKVYW